MNYLLFAGSLRGGSLNKKLLHIAEGILLKSPGCQVTVVDIKALELPVYDGDIETQGMPLGVVKLGDLIKNSQALVIASPEYNASISSTLKNTIDWVSRLRPVPLEKKPILLLGASPGALGAIRALNHERACFETLGAFVYPQGFGLARADQAFDDEGYFKDASQQEKLSALITKFRDYAEKLTGSN
jgi:chromate reductase, NAD(P)H dehydrogenase (quinone)